LAAWLYATYPAPAAAQQIAPLLYDLAPEGEGASQTVSVANTGASPIAFEIVVAAREYSIDGVPTDVAAPDVFEIAPDALWLEPGDNRTVRVRYTGPAAIGESQMFVISFRQAPVMLTPDQGQTGIDLQYEFKTFAQVVPAGAKPQIMVAAVRQDAADIVVTLANAGTRYGRIDDGTLAVQSPGGMIELDPEMLAATFGSMWILPGARRELRFALPQGWAGTALSARWQPLQAAAP